MASLMSTGGKVTIVDLGEIGNGGTIDVKSKLPNVYARLKSENFFEVPTQLVLYAYSAGIMELTQYANTTRATYDSSTGILTAKFWGAYIDEAGIGNTSCGVQKRRIYCVY